VDLPDVNVLVYAFRATSPWNPAARRLLDGLLNGSQPFGVASLVVSGFLRVVTMPGIAKAPADKPAALEFVRALLAGPNARLLEPGRAHMDEFLRLVQMAGVHGNAIPDAYLAALAIEHDCEFVTLDGGFARFPGLRWRLLA
jgi:uncharacterized protein